MLSPTLFSFSFLQRLAASLLILTILWLAILWAIALP